MKHYIAYDINRDKLLYFIERNNNLHLLSEEKSLVLSDGIYDAVEAVYFKNIDEIIKKLENTIKNRKYFYSVISKKSIFENKGIYLVAMAKTRKDLLNFLRNKISFNNIRLVAKI